MIPREVADLLAKRAQARAARDFALADALRDQIESAGFDVRDSPSGATLEPKLAFIAVDPASITDTLGEPATLGLSLHVLWEGEEADLRRFLGSLPSDAADIEVVIVDNASPDGESIEQIAALHPAARVVHLDRELGWAAARNAGLRSSRGALVALVDLSIEATGDLRGPVARVFDDPSVGLAGPFGLVSDDLREWRPSDGPEVDAIEGYFLVARREHFAKGLINERFTWYRNADIDLSFQVRDAGAKAVVVPLPVQKHIHRGWEALDDAERQRRSKRNHSVFLDRWKDRTDLLTGV